MGKSQKNYMSIKSKLMAAVAMLLVASFMVVSSTYAWFTLSTAPEVTGITTTIGANGSLEMALLVYDGTDATITSKEIALTKISSTIGSSAFAPAAQKVVSNKNWGNLVDLDDPSYGLDKITLLPARLNVTGDGSDAAPYTLAAAMLKTPEYGADGRVTTLAESTVTGIFKDGAVESSDYTGVRVIGTASGMSAQQLGLRNAQSTLANQLALAKTKASQSLQDGIGSKLASIAAQHATVQSGTDENEYDITLLGEMLTRLEASNKAIGDALKAYFEGALAVAYKNKTENEYTIAKAALNGATLEEIMGGTFEIEGQVYTFPEISTVTAAYNIYKENETNLGNARTQFNAITEENLVKSSWTDINNILIQTSLLNMDGITINDYTLTEVKDKAFTIFTSGAINVQMPEGTGVHANIAQVVGSNYYSSVELSGLSYGSIVMEPGDKIPAKMTTEVTDFVSPSMTGWNAKPDESATASEKITDFYGYALDFAFRTNATSSNLMLQTTPVDRIYSEGGVPDTMGHGSTMTFAATDATTFSEADVETLMKAIRLVFTDGTGKIVAIGAIDQTASATVSSGEVTGNIYLYDYEFGADGVLTLTDKKVTLGDDDQPIEGKTELMPLEKNKATALSVHVYLDGDIVDNTMVANAASSMSGKLNLQFSSSAKLVPMQYTPLTNQTASETTAATTTTAETTTVTP